MAKAAEFNTHFVPRLSERSRRPAGAGLARRARQLRCVAEAATRLSRRRIRTLAIRDIHRQLVKIAKIITI